MISHRALWESFRGLTAREGTRILPTHPQSIAELATLDDYLDNHASQWCPGFRYIMISV